MQNKSSRPISPTFRQVISSMIEKDDVMPTLSKEQEHVVAAHCNVKIVMKS